MELVYCVDRGVYEALEYGRAYPVVADLGSHIRVKRPDGKVRKYPSWTFGPQPPPRLLRWKLDDPIEDPLCGWVEVSFDLEGSVRWVAFVTPAFLARQLPQLGHSRDGSGHGNQRSDHCWLPAAPPGTGRTGHPQPFPGHAALRMVRTSR